MRSTIDRALAAVLAGAVVFAAALLPLVGFAYTPLEVGGAVSRWPNATVTFGIGWDPDEAWDGAVRGAFSAWNEHLTGLTVVEDPALRGQSDIGAPSHLVVYDPDNGTGWFPDASFVAVTPIWTDGAGAIVDADIVLNGRDHAFSTDGTPGTFDVEAVLAHEVGHFVGFDHSGVRGASLYPYVATTDTTPRTLSGDDRAAARSLQPSGHTRLTGTVTRADGTPIRGAQVIAVDAGGHALASAVSGPDGRYDLVGLEPGTLVRVFAAPFDGPVSTANLLLSGVETDFQTTEHSGGPFVISQGSQADLGTIACAAKTVTITGLWTSPVQAGQSGSVTIVGTGLAPAGTTWSVLGPAGVTVSAASSSVDGSTWSLTVSAAANAAPGLRTLVASVAGVQAIEPGCVEVVGAAPVVASVSPSAATAGDLLTIHGSGFQPGATVRIGGLCATGVVWLDDRRLRCNAPAAQGLAGVQVVNPDGLGALKSDSVSFGGAPPPEEPPPEPTTPPPSPSGNTAPNGPSNPTGNAPTRGPVRAGGGGGGCSLAPAAPGPPGWWAWLVLLSILALGRMQAASALRIAT